MAKVFSHISAETHATIVALKNWGWSQVKIGKEPKLYLSTVPRTLNRHKELGHTGDQKKVCPRKVQSPKMIKVVREHGRQNPKVSAMKLARDLPMGRTMPNLIFKDDLVKTWKPMAYRHLLSEASKAK